MKRGKRGGGEQLLGADAQKLGPHRKCLPPTTTDATLEDLLFGFQTCNTPTFSLQFSGIIDATFQGFFLAFLTSLMRLVPSKITPTAEYFAIMMLHFYEHCCFAPRHSLQHSNILPSLMPRPKISFSIFTHCAIIDSTLALKTSFQFANIFDATPQNHLKFPTFYHH